LAIHLQTLRSSSAGNCLAFWTARSSILIDCGVKTQREFHEALELHRRQAGTLDAVIVSHAHGDHASRASLKVLAAEGLPILADARVLRQLREGHDWQDWRERPTLRAFPDARFEVGDFRITPFEVPHAPHVPNFGFDIVVRDGHRKRRLVVCTDFNDYAGLLPHFLDADAILLEANHDLGLLREHPNPSSRYHLNNVKAASLLYHAVRKSEAPPGMVMLAHLSEERNRRTLAVGEVRRLFERSGLALRFHLDAAPASRPSEVITV
jgi:phosphoribosyl 1,2-cyclic phosphodiesterase